MAPATKRKKVKHTKQQLIDTRKAIRQKLLALKLNKNESEDSFERQYRPIIEPLKKIIESSQVSKKIKLEPKHEPKQEADIQDLHFMNKVPAANDVSKLNVTKIEVDKDEEEEDEKTIFESEEDSAEETFASPNEDAMVGADYDPEIIAHVDAMQMGDHDTYDVRTGVRYTKEYGLTIGDSPLIIRGKDFRIKNQEFKGTKGLISLLFLNNPTGFTQNDLEVYAKILKLTYATRRDYKSSSQVQGVNTPKYRNIIKPIMADPYTVALQSSYSSPKSSRPQQKQGEGLRNKSVVENKPFQYVYYNDINELIDRLILLHASQSAGNNSHLNEITSIEEELREANIIV